MRISSRFVDFNLTMCQFSRAHHEEVVNMSWVDWCGLGLLVQEHNYSATTHSLIATGESKPVQSHPYGIVPGWKEELKEEVMKFMKQCIIKPS